MGKLYLAELWLVVAVETLNPLSCGAEPKNPCDRVTPVVIPVLGSKNFLSTIYKAKTQSDLHNSGTWPTHTWLINPKYPTKGGALKASNTYHANKSNIGDQLQVLVPRIPLSPR